MGMRMSEREPHLVFSVAAVPQVSPTVFWGITLCNQLKIIRRFGITRRLHLQVRRMGQARNQC